MNITTTPTTTPQLSEKINLLAVGLMVAAGTHMALSLLSISGVLAGATSGALGIILTALKLSWTAAGFFAGAYVGYNAIFMLNGRNFTKTRIAAIGAIVLPLIGVSGIITAFVLIPLGAATLILLRLPDWKAAFGVEVPALSMVEEPAMVEQ